jgi:hypothetical protein
MAFMGFRAEEHTSRQVIDVAIGVLVGRPGMPKRSPVGRSDRVRPVGPAATI